MPQNWRGTTPPRYQDSRIFIFRGLGAVGRGQCRGDALRTGFGGGVLGARMGGRQQAGNRAVSASIGGILGIGDLLHYSRLEGSPNRHSFKIAYGRRQAGGGWGGSWPLRRPKKILRIRDSLTFQNAIPESGFLCQNHLPESGFW